MISTSRFDAEIGPFIERINSSPDVKVALEAHFPDPSTSAVRLAEYANEAQVGLALVAPLLRPGMRVLEIGSGIGVLARFLTERGVDIVGIEPGTQGFDFIALGRDAIGLMQPAMKDDYILKIGAEALDPDKHGYFDLIYSTNVLEHIPDLDAAFAGMASVMATGGQMVHACPNYFIPYEPHFGIPLIPFFPHATHKLFPLKIATLPGIWEDFNFVTARRVKRLSRRLGLQVSFDRGVLGQTLQRLQFDDMFRRRHGCLGALLQLNAVQSTLGGIVDRLPGEILTPMVMRMTRSAEGGLTTQMTKTRPKDRLS